MNQSVAYYKGYEAKAAEITSMGWTAARDKFNRENVPGRPWMGSVDGLAFARGEFAALSDRMDAKATT